MVRQLRQEDWEFQATWATYQDAVSKTQRKKKRSILKSIAKASIVLPSFTTSLHLKFRLLFLGLLLTRYLYTYIMILLIL
jgi:hypothetical protein